jgi:hypothetical protein
VVGLPCPFGASFNFRVFLCAEFAPTNAIVKGSRDERAESLRRRGR